MALNIWLLLQGNCVNLCCRTTKTEHFARRRGVCAVAADWSRKEKWGCSLWAYDNRLRGREGKTWTVMLRVIFPLNEGCLSQFRQQGSSAQPARIWNLSDSSSRASVCWTPVIRASAAPSEKEEKTRSQCHVQNDTDPWIHAVTDELEWSASPQIPADAPPVKRWGFWCRPDNPSRAAANRKDPNSKQKKHKRGDL